ncbi:uncharacterized protein [Clytia hemisphaerica]|uniref:Uncharacterized protein n=1 Tax=Clytia hemisphaerica TaxID=252671 RepID=A0A7M5WYC3_9CNID|eukprot:TCONS_00032817-protein
MATETLNADRSNEISSDFISSDSLNQNEASQPQGGIVSRVAGGAYNTTATVLGGAVGGAKYVASPVVGGATWITGAALSTSLGVAKSSFGLAKSVGSYVLPARFAPAVEKDKCE